MRMTRDQLKQLEVDLWSGADNMRATEERQSAGPQPLRYHRPPAETGRRRAPRQAGAKVIGDAVPI
jgi:hypothetical protein